MADLLEMSSRKTEYRDTQFLNADHPEETARMLVGILEKSGFRPLAENAAAENDADRNCEEIRGRLERAPLIFAGGRGLHTRDNLQKLRRLAALYGAEYAVSRPFVLEGFAPEERMIGVTGASVKPELLFTAGISGSIQFMGGVKNSCRVIAINNNFNAQIFRYAREAVLADAQTLLDAMLKILEGNSEYTEEQNP